ncbi:hypothetical protein AB0K21_36260 [Streptosporangium sp. NPDC049248]|uniref:hypothetical protein n=1 Tax=Streptosporangium sp. NPDC049248 TaxID=3155651 RepID=UPI00341875CA
MSSETPNIGRYGVFSGLAWQEAGVRNYVNNWLRGGFTEDDLAGGGSDRLIDALFAWGDEERIRTRVEDFHAAGADQVALQAITASGFDLPREEWRHLAEILR